MLLSTRPRLGEKECALADVRCLADVGCLADVQCSPAFGRESAPHVVGRDGGGQHDYMELAQAQRARRFRDGTVLSATPCACSPRSRKQRAKRMFTTCHVSISSSVCGMPDDVSGYHRHTCVPCPSAPTPCNPVNAIHNVMRRVPCTPRKQMQNSLPRALLDLVVLGNLLRQPLHILFRQRLPRGAQGRRQRMRRLAC